MIIYIAGLQRSGTTFLQSQLLQYNNVAALGEVSQTINAIRNVDIKMSKWRQKLSLRKESYWNPKTYPVLLERVEKDIFWSSVKNDIQTAADINSAIDIVYTRANEIYPGHIIIDSSKNIGYLQRITQIDKFKNNVKVLFCIRDYRGWLYSTEKHRKRINIPERNSTVEIYKWFYSNKKIIKYLRENFKDNYRIISYDKLVFSYAEIMERIVSFCSLKKLAGNGSEQKFHEILGSQSLKKNTDQKDVRYDVEWFSYSGSCLEKPISDFNRKVYLKYTV